MQDVAAQIAGALPAADYRDKRVLLIVPDGTRTAPVGLIFRILHEQIGSITKAFDVMIALGTHAPMTQAEIHERLEISAADRITTYRRVQFFNHEWQNPSALRNIGVIP